MDVAIRGALVATQDSTRRVLRADVGIEAGKVAHIGSVPAASREIDARGQLVIPGLVNLHTHAAMALLRGYADDLPLEQWLRERIWPAERHLTEGAVRAGTRLAIAEMLASGTTTFHDMYFFAQATAEEAKQIGIRATLGVPIMDFDTPDAKAGQGLQAAQRFAARWKSDPLIRPNLPIHSAYGASPATLDEASVLSKERELQVHAHLHETRFEVYDVQAKYGKRPFDLFAERGLHRGAIFAHGGWLTKAELRALADARASVAHCPVSNFKLGTGGWLALPELWDAGGRAGLGTDGCASNNSLDMFESMKFAALAQKQHRWDAAAAPAQKVFDMATRDGAAALGLSGGSIEEGKSADLAILNLATPHGTPFVEPASHVVYAAKASDVTHTIVAGRVVYADRAFETLALTRTLEQGRVASENLRNARKANSTAL
ncbi:MAG: amidohydrolase [Thermoplasmatota archaeon]